MINKMGDNSANGAFEFYYRTLWMSDKMKQIPLRPFPAFLSLLLLLVGCASPSQRQVGPAWERLSQPELARLGTEERVSVVNATGAPLSFSSQSSINSQRAGLLLGPIGMLATASGAHSRSQSAGKDLQVRLGLPDPNELLLESFVSRAALDPTLPAFEPVNLTIANNELPTLRGKVATPSVLELRTEGWQAGQFTLKTGVPDRLVYRARARLIRPQDGAVIWTATCSAGTDAGTDLDAPTSESPKIVQEKLRRLVDACADTLLRQLLGKAPRPSDQSIGAAMGF